MPTMYSDSLEHGSAANHQARQLEGKAALWTEAAQKQHQRLTSLPDSAQAHVRMEIGYLEEAKQAAEELSRKAK